MLNIFSLKKPTQVQSSAKSGSGKRASAAQLRITKDLNELELPKTCRKPTCRPMDSKKHQNFHKISVVYLLIGNWESLRNSRDQKIDLDPLTMEYLINVHSRLLISNFFITLHALIRSCTFIVFWRKFQSARLLHPAHRCRLGGPRGSAPPWDLKFCLTPPWKIFEQVTP